jgi:hypothetical protein
LYFSWTAGQGYTGSSSLSHFERMPYEDEMFSMNTPP